MKDINIKTLTKVSMLITIMIIGSMIKITGSIALDSFAGFVGAAVFGPYIGMLLGILGHLLSSMVSGFPMGIHVHVLISLLMGVCLFFYGKTKKMGMSTWVSDLVAYIINVPLSLLVLTPILTFSVWILFIPLSVATIVNIMCAEIVLKSRKMNKSFKGGV